MIKKPKKHTHARCININIMLLQWMTIITLLLLNVTPALGLTLEDEQKQDSSTNNQLMEITIEDTQVAISIESNDDKTITIISDETTSNEVTDSASIVKQKNDTTNESMETTNTSLSEETIMLNNSEKISPAEYTETKQNTATPSQTSFIIETTNTRSETSIAQLQLRTSQPYNEVSAEISTTYQKPPNIPNIKQQNENDYVESYVSITLRADNLVLTNNNIQSITMIIQIQKQTNHYSSDIHHQILALSCSGTMPFDTSFPLKEQFVTQYNTAFWQPIIPVEITADERYYYYHVETSRYFATFAIVGTEIVEVQPYQSGIPEIPWGAIVCTIIAVTALLFIVLFKTGFIYQIEENTDGTRKKKILRQTNQKWSYKVRLTSTLPDLQTIRAPTLYFPMTANAPQVLNASTDVQHNSEEVDEDLMYL